MTLHAVCMNYLHYVCRDTDATPARVTETQQLMMERHVYTETLCQNVSKNPERQQQVHQS